MTRTDPPHPPPNGNHGRGPHVGPPVERPALRLTDPIRPARGPGGHRQPNPPYEGSPVEESAPPPEAGDSPQTTDGSELNPRLAPEVEAQVRDLLASSAEAGPMPEAVEARILQALSAEAHTWRPADHRVPPIPRRLGQTDHDVLSPLIRQRQRPRTLFAAAAVAAAAAVVAVGGSTLHLNERSGETAVAVAASPPTPSSPGPGTDPRVHIQLSTTAYDASNLTTRARTLLASPGAPLRDGAAEAPSLGPIATRIGLASCLRALGVTSPEAVSADLATYAGEPAAIIVVTDDGRTTAYAVRRSCTTDAPEVLLGATPVP